MSSDVLDARSLNRIKETRQTNGTALFGDKPDENKRYANCKTAGAEYMHRDVYDTEYLKNENSECPRKELTCIAR